MDIKVTVNGPQATLLMGGRFDFSAHRAFKEAYAPLLLQKGFAAIEVDLERVEYVDSSALGMLLLLRERAQAAGIAVILSHPAHAIAQILEIANFGKLFPIQ